MDTISRADGCVVETTAELMRGRHRGYTKMSQSTAARPSWPAHKRVLHIKRANTPEAMESFWRAADESHRKTGEKVMYSTDGQDKGWSTWLQRLTRPTGYLSNYLLFRATAYITSCVLYVVVNSYDEAHAITDDRYIALTQNRTTLLLLLQLTAAIVAGFDSAIRGFADAWRINIVSQRYSPHPTPSMAPTSALHVA